MKFCGEPFNIRGHYSSISGYVYLGFNEAAIQFAPIFSTQKDPAHFSVSVRSLISAVLSNVFFMLKV